MVGTASSGNRNPKDHGLLLFMSSEHVLALARLQAQLSLGRSYAGLLALNEGFFVLGVISEVEYQKLKEKYSAQLVKEAARDKVELAKKEQQEKHVEALEKHYGEVLKQWPTLNEGARAIHLQKAKEVSEQVKNAKLVLDLVSEEVAQNG